jgi:hypothetical protein
VRNVESDTGQFLTLAVEEVYYFSGAEIQARTQVIQIDRVQPKRFRLDGVGEYHVHVREGVKPLSLCSKPSLDLSAPGAYDLFDQSIRQTRR